MRIYCSLILLIISWSWGQASPQHSLSILPVQLPYDEYPQAQEMDAYLLTALNHEGNQWTYQRLPIKTQACRNLDCMLQVLQKDSNHTDFILIPELIIEGSFHTLILKLVHIQTLRVHQQHQMEFRQHHRLDFQKFKAKLKEINDIHFSATSDLQEYFNSQPKKQQSWLTQVGQWWPVLLFLPVLFIYN